MIKLAIVGTGNMAGAHAENFKKIKGVKIVSCCDIREEAAANFAEKHSIPSFYTDLKEMLDKEKPDAVTNVTIDAAHAPTCIEILKRKIHVLCEKPLATNAPEAKKMVDAAKKAGVINMVNLSYRNSSALQKAAQIISSGKLGPIRHVQASYYQSWLAADGFRKNLKEGNIPWRLCTAAGSMGVLGDLGVHIFDFATFAAGDLKTIDCNLKTFDKGVGFIQKNGMKMDANDTFISTVEFQNGALGTIQSSRWATGHNNSIMLEVCGMDGALRIDLDKSYTEYEVCISKKERAERKWKKVKAPKTPNMFQRFITSIKTGKNDQPDFERGWMVQKYLDAALKSGTENKTVKI